ncbi:MAG: TonB-dependent receptor [Limisphaerales bacterium]
MRLFRAHLRRLAVVLMLILISISRDVLGQDGSAGGSISGTVTDSFQDNPVPAVIVTIRGTTLAAQASGAGVYQFRSVPAGTYTLIIAKTGYKRVVVEGVRVGVGVTTRADVKMGPTFFELPAFEALTEPIPDQRLEILDARKNSSVVTEGLSADDFSRLAVNDAAGAVAKVTGVTVTDGKYAVVRGLSDRYTSSSMNGAEIPSADPEKQAAQLDLFPAQMIARVEVKKTFMPDLPGGFTGGAINIVTKSFPDQFTFNLSAGASYNPQSNLRNEFLSYDGGATDYLGFDDGGRALPAGLAGAHPNAVVQDRNLAQTFLVFRRFGIPFVPGQAAFERNNGLANSFGDSRFEAFEDGSSLNRNFGMSFGAPVKFMGKKAGFFGGLSYDRSFDYYEDRIRNRYNGSSPAQLRQSIRETAGTDSVAWGAVFATGVKPSEGHEIGFNFAYTQNTDKRAVHGEGQGTTNDEDIPIKTDTLEYNERNLQSYQVKGSHEFPELADLKFEWLTSIAATVQDVPDLRLIERVQDTPGGPFHSSTATTPDRPQRQFRNTQENNFNNRIDVTLPFVQWSGEEGYFKLGAYQSIADREFRIRGYEFQYETGDVALLDGGLDPNQVLITPLAGNFSDSAGSRTIEAGYMMAEFPFMKSLKALGGVRYETTRIEVTTTDLFRGAQPPASLVEPTLLPAAGVIISPGENVNIRLNWSQTIARPSFRELTPIALVTSAGGRQVIGNPNLDLTTTANYDARVEWFPEPGQIYSLGAFYKEISGPIERVLVSALGDIRFENGKDASLFGVEAEMRRDLNTFAPWLDGFDLGINYAFLLSEIPRNALELANKQYDDVDATRPMFDQPTYVLNADLTHESEYLDMTSTLSFNLTGRRLILVNSRGPDTYMEPVPSLNLTFTKRFGDRWKLKFTARNLLNPLIKEEYDADEIAKVIDSNGDFMNGFDPYQSAYRRGRSYGISLSYSF